MVLRSPYFSISKLATDFVTDLTDGLLLGDDSWLATDFVTDLTDGLLLGDSKVVFYCPGINLYQGG
jgi:hypothetical protein